MSDHSVIRRLKERKMVQWAIAYGAAALVLLELADFLAEAFDWPMVTLRLISVVVAFAFLAVLVIAWYHGEQGHQRVKTTEALLLAAIVLGGGTTAWWVGTRTAAAVPATAAEGQPGGASSDLMMTSAMDLDDGRTGVAILPFLTIGTDADSESFADGITEDIIAEVASVEGLRVISRTSVMQYRGSDRSIPQIGRELNVDVILEGSVRRVGDDVRIVATLIDAQTDEHLWTSTYDRNIKDILQVQTDVARDVAAQMRERLGLDVLLAANTDRPEVDPAAFEQVVEGRKLAESAEPEERQRGVEMLMEAVVRDSNLVTVALPALAELAAPEADRMGMMQPPAPPSPDVAAAMQRAMRHAPNAPAVRTFSIRRALGEADFEEAETEAGRAIEENPNNAMAHRYYGLLKGRQEQYDEAVEHLREAVRLDPHSATIGTDLGEILYAAGRTDAATAQLRRVLAEHPGHVPARVALGLAYQAAGEHERAVAELRRAAQESRGNPMVMGSLGWVFATQGALAEARAVLDTLRVRSETRGASVAIAQVLSGLGEMDEAAQWLWQTGDGEGNAEIFRWIGLDPKLKVVFRDSIAAAAAAAAGQRRRPSR